MSTIERSKTYFWGVFVPDDYLECVTRQLLYALEHWTTPKFWILIQKLLKSQKLKIVVSSDHPFKKISFDQGKKSIIFLPMDLSTYHSLHKLWAENMAKIESVKLSWIEDDGTKLGKEGQAMLDAVLSPWDWEMKLMTSDEALQIKIELETVFS